MLITVGIYRPQWARGESESALQRKSDNKRCCLGFAALRLGFTEAQILGHLFPRTLVTPETMSRCPGLVEQSAYTTTPTTENTSKCGAMMGINDGLLGKSVIKGLHKESDREKLLKEKAREAGYRFIFTDEAWLVPVINKVDRVLHRIADLWDRFCNNGPAITENKGAGRRRERNRRARSSAEWASITNSNSKVKQ